MSRSAERDEIDEKVRATKIDAQKSLLRLGSLPPAIRTPARALLLLTIRLCDKLKELNIEGRSYD